MQKLTLFLSLLAIILVIIFVITLGGEKDYTPPPKKGANEIKMSPNIDESNPNNKIKGTESPTSESSESSGSSGSELSSSASTEGCIERQISYSLTNFHQSSICNSYNTGYCIDKTVSCSLDVRNLDDATTGVFAILFTFYNENDQEDVIDVVIKTDTLSPHSTVAFQYKANIQSQGQNGNANKQISCSAISSEIPKKQFC